MFTRYKWILIYNIVIVLFLHFNTICTTNSRIRQVQEVIKFPGIVENITVCALEDKDSLKNDDTLRSLKLNISWVPPRGERQPSSYSIMITSIAKDSNKNKMACTEGFASYTAQNNDQFSLLVPQTKLISSISDVQIRLNCTYKIQVYANPRARPIGKLPEVIYTVPVCVGSKCSCMNAKTNLPVPKVEVIRMQRNFVINWNIISNNSHVRFYIISIGIPLLTSKAGHPVYNITRISNVTSATNTFTWDSKINNQYITVQNGYKILVAAADRHDCLGNQGDFIVAIEVKIETTNGNILWLLFIGIVTCIILGLVSLSIRSKNGYLLLPRSMRRRQTMPELSTCKSQWPDLVFQKRNVLYVEQKTEDTYYKVSKTDEFEIPYNCINLMCELGKGQFGRVYLGSLNNNEGTLVAVKMSQCSNISNELEARRQLLEEIEAMKTAGFHPHLVGLIGYCTSPDNPICIILEYMTGGDLLVYLHSRRKIESDRTFLCSFEKHVAGYVNITEKDKCKNNDSHNIIKKQQFLKFALDIAKGMEHLEAKGITHRDLAARNILLTSDLTLKVSDFGLSRNGIYVINNTIGKVRQLPIRWMSPEAIHDHTFSSKSDVWSFGIVLWEIGTLGSFPYPNVKDDELLSYLTQDMCRLTCPDTISHDIYRIMCSCWNTIPQDRPSFAQLILNLQTLKEPEYSVINEMNNPCYSLLSN